MFSYKLRLVCLMVVHCVLSLPVGDEMVPGEDSAEDQVVDDLITAEHHGGYGGYYQPSYGYGGYGGGYGGYGNYGGYGGGYGGYGGHGHGHHHHHHGGHYSK